MVSPQFYGAQRRLAIGCSAFGSFLMVVAIILFGIHTRVSRKKYMGHKVSRRLIYASWGILVAGCLLLVLGHIMSLLNLNKAESEEGYGGAQHHQHPAVGMAQPMHQPGGPPGYPQHSMGRNADVSDADDQYISAPTSYSQAPGSGVPPPPRRKSRDSEVHVQFPQS
ncbi:hypothetical protein H4R33_001284 [Dimargaris cristalligena]|uniref:Uncharacterized protein n=1 Tax=Dimargaris cristalligena TaxID=215637 RepID=A0A4P9ZYS1_9FUNG|nr:hypothetical protein H4R33_001284 [Dimargaris cristalligena]RKP38833.1 hypothetical protein BJ085DRAFT_38127 [Dimargaris cristalligena]|eukprot:RKP38833.1 hypothetical protein BJ085DRAFT_38127 [Dimargaris cristalligena]